MVLWGGEGNMVYLFIRFSRRRGHAATVVAAWHTPFYKHVHEQLAFSAHSRKYGGEQHACASLANHTCWGITA